MVIRILLTICFLLNAFAALAANGGGKTLIVGSEENFPPFSIGSTDKTADGFTIDLWREVAKEAGLNYSIRVRPWGQLLQEFREGKIDVLINIAQSDERQKYTDFSVPHVTVSGAIFVRRNDSRIRTEADLARKSIIVFNSDLAHEYALSKGWQKQLAIVSTPQDGLQLLASGYHDAMLLSKLAGMQTITKLNLNNLRALDAKAGYSQKFSFGVQKGNWELLARINEGLALTKASGSYDTIYNKWFGIYESKTPTLRDMLPYLAPFVLIFLAITSYNFRKRRNERQRAAEKLAASEENLRLILDSAGEAIYGIDTQGNCTFCNPACLKILLYDRPEDLIGKNMHDMIHHSHSDGSPYPVEECFIYKAFQEGKAIRVDNEVLWRSDGTSFAADYRSYPQFKNGKTIGAVVIFSDITERKQTEVLTQSLTQRLRLATSSAHLGVWDWNVKENTIVWDDRMFELYGITPHTFSESVDAWMNGLHPEDKETALAECQAALEGKKEFDTVFRVLHPDGTVKHIKANGLVIRGTDNSVERMIGINADITGAVEAEQEKARLGANLLQSQKMESIGNLAGGVAHDFNNKLSVILGHTCLALSEPLTEQLRESLEEIRKATEQSADLTRQLLAFARKQTIVPKLMDLNETVANMLKMLQRLIGENINLSWKPAGNLWLVKLDPSQVDQILANLCVNARDAVKNHGNITIETSNCEIGENYCSQHTYVLPGDYVRLTVSDNGCGITREAMDHIFEPFFTTKESGKGTGLGLATVFGIVKQNNGFINVYSEPDMGTTFTVYLPRYNGKFSQTIKEEAVATTPRGQETILLVEDEPAILKMATTILDKQGYTVLPANSPAEAIEIAREHKDRIKLLITDVIMPKMNGKELASNLNSDIPGIKCLFMSGYTTDAIAQHGVLGENVQFIQKPFSMPALANKVREVLDNRTALQ